MTQVTQFVRHRTIELLSALVLDAWPSPATRMDYGIETPEHLGALRHAFMCDGVSLNQFQAAFGEGREIQKLISETNPYRHAKFVTVWDTPSPEQGGEEEEES